MVRYLLAALVLVLSIVPAFTVAEADEGMWIPSELARTLPGETLRKMGLELGLEKIWADEGVSLKDGILQVVEFTPRGPFGFGSAAFVSDQGLILTNHHVAFDAIAALSTPEHDYVKGGFRAETLADEARCEGMGVRICVLFENVTNTIRAGLTADLAADQRDKVIEVVSRKLVEDAESHGFKDAEVATMSSGNDFYLVAYDTFRDVRLVHAPPQSIGEYGGDIDNWMWPRHTGDFSYLRAYVAPDGSRAEYSKDNVPFKPARHLEISTKGYAPGDFTFIMGFPGRTYRYRTSYSIDYREKIYYPESIERFAEMIGDLEKQSRDDEAQRLKNAAQIKSLANTKKNFEGMRDGLKARHIVERRRHEEEAFRVWVSTNPERQRRWGDVFPRLRKLYDELYELRRMRQADGLDRDELQQRQLAFNRNVTEVRRRLAEAWAEWKGYPLYPDANSTLRFTYGTVRGYSPRDAVDYRYLTTPAGILEKHTGKVPFDAPQKLRAAVARRDFGRWIDEATRTVPVNFLTDTDITGGNSGSPIMNGRGEMIGIAFDGNYEAMTGDFFFEPDINRTINVDIRYVLWCTEKLAGMTRLIDEMDLVSRP